MKKTNKVKRQARGKFLEDVQKLGFPVNIQGPQALAMRRQEPLDLETKKKRRL